MKDEKDFLKKKGVDPEKGVQYYMGLNGEMMRLHYGLRVGTQTKDCGCVDVTTRPVSVKSCYVVETTFCNKHTKEIRDKRETDRREDESRHARSIEGAEELNCNNCGTHICYVDASDLNCSYFYCDTCKGIT